MGIFSRFADIVNSNLNALLDKAEDPEKMIRMIIQEMEDTLVEVRTTSARTIAQKKDYQRRLSQVQAQMEDWQNKAELALSKDREDLAKAALAEKNEAEVIADTIQKQIADLEINLNKLSTEVTQLQEKIVDAKARQKALVMRHQTAASRVKVKQHLSDYTIDDAMSKFDAYERKLDDLDAEAESYDIGRQHSLSEEIAQLEQQESLQAQLDALKSKLNKAQETK
jgi:phage shock protein A